MNKPNILSQEEIDKLLNFGWGDENMGTKMVIAYNAMELHLRAGGKLTQKQDDDFNWLEEKINKWKD